MQYRSVRGVARFAKAAILVEVLAMFTLVAALGGQAAVGVPIDQAPPGSTTMIVALGMCFSGLAVMGTLVLAAAFFLTWLHRATSSAIALGAELTHSPGWAVGCWFIPIANLWLPLQAVQSLDAGATPEGELEVTIGRRDTVSWWTLWLLGGVIGAVASRLTEGALVATVVVHFLTFLLRLGAAALVIRIITRITENLERKAQEAGVGSTEPLRF